MGIKRCVGSLAYQSVEPLSPSRPRNFNELNTFKMKKYISNIRVLVALSVCALLALTGCSTVGPDFNDMADAYEKSVETQQKQTLLSNMLRAARKMPLVFTDITQVQGTGAIGTASSLDASITSLDPGSIAGFFSAGSGSGVRLGSNITTQRTFGFTLASLNNERFFEGFLTPITYEDLHYFMSSNEVPDALVASMLFDSIQITEAKGTKKLYLNDPGKPEYEQFKKVLYQLLDDGLMTEMSVKKTNFGPVMSREEFLKIMPEISKLLPAKILPLQLSFKPETYQLSIMIPTPKFCMTAPREQRRYGKNMDCETSEKTNAQNLQRMNKATQQTTDDTVLIKLRSTREVFTYLGRLLALQMGDAPFVTKIRNENSGTKEEIPILVINRNVPMSPNESLISTRFLGELFSIPLKNSGYSTQIFDLLSVMVIMNKIPGSIQAPPGVLIR